MDKNINSGNDNGNNNNLVNGGNGNHNNNIAEHAQQMFDNFIKVYQQQYGVIKILVERQIGNGDGHNGVNGNNGFGDGSTDGSLDYEKNIP